MKKMALLTLSLVLLSSAWAQAAIIDAPHNETNGIKCGSCHTYSMWWQYSPAKLSASPNYDTVVNSLCMTCHSNNGNGPSVIGHGGAAMESTKYHNGMWTEGCTACHNPHEQRQFYWARSNVNPYLVTGTITSLAINSPVVGQTTVNYSGATNNPSLTPWPSASWSDKSANNPGRGLILVHNKNEAFNTFSIISATATKIVVKGIINPTDISTTNCSQAPNCASANTFGLMYGQYLRDSIVTPASGTRPVKFFDPKDGFIDTVNTPPTGVCQVCHTQTHYWNSDGSKTTHNAGTNCTICHFHNNGFKPVFPTHDAFVSKESTCTTCHNGTDSILDIHKGDCSHCHTQPPALALKTARQNVVAIQRGSCFTCHGSAFSHPNVSHSNISGPNCSACHNTASVINDIHMGNCLACHASSKTAVINTISAGKLPGASVLCEDCHTGTANGATAAHGTTPATAAAAHDKFNVSANCSSCHVIGTTEQRLALHQTCTTCHSSTMTAAINTITSGRDGTAITCDNCHTTPHNTDLDHNNRVTSGLTLNCATCHGVGAQSAIDTLHKGCGTCHNYSGAKITPSIVANAINTGKSGTAVNCETCHGVSYPHPSATHSKVLPVDACVTCHAGANIITDIHKTNCGGCHSSTMTEVIQAISTRNGGTCKTCHITPHVASVDQGSVHNIIATGNCSICHYPNLSYSPHNNLTSATYCQNCHTGTSFDDIVAIHKNDCLKCHLSADPTKNAAIASGRLTPGTPVNCETCHGVNFGHPNAQHAKVQAVDQCVTCHAGTNIITDIHRSNCLGCHTSSRLEVHSAIETLTGGTCKTCHDAAHTTAVDQATLHNIIATGDCTVCHYPSMAYSPHNNLSNATYCLNCHTGTSFDDIVAIHKNDCLKCHLSPDPNKSAVIATGRLTPGTPVNCETCHGTNFGHPNATHSKVQAAPECVVCHIGSSIIVDIHKSNCLNCHKSTRPQIRTAIDTRGGGTCKTCHAGVHASVPDIGTLHLLTYSECTECHYPNIAAKPHNNLSAVAECSSCHGGAAFSEIVTTHGINCMTCHLSGLSEVIGAIGNGRSNPGAPVNCLSCHTGTTNGAPAHGITAGTVAAQHDRFAGSTACGSCHAVASTEQRISLHPTCTTCHGSTLSAVASAISAGRAGTSVNCETCHTGTSSGAPVHGITTPPEHTAFAASQNCSGCHTSGTWQQRLSLHTDCFVCHSSSLSAVIQTIATGKAGTSISCENCHIGTTIGAPVHGTTTATVAPQHDKFAGSTICGSCHTVTTAEQRIAVHPTCTTCHGATLSAVISAISGGRSGATVNCETCHTGTASGAPVHSSTNAPEHTTFTASPACSSCHVSGSWQQRLNLHPDCFACHSSTLSAVTTTINAGKAGTTISCENCHTGTSSGVPVHGTTIAAVTVVHDRFAAASNCTSCHAIGTIEQRLSLHPSCNTCHSSPQASVVSAITTGRAGTTVNCESCHTGTADGAAGHGATPASAAAAHDNFIATSSCASCHPNGSAEQRIGLHKVCTTCHSSTNQTVISTIASGREGTQVQCVSCHSGNLGTTHHANPNAASGNCTWCHADPRYDWTSSRPGDNGGPSGLPTQLPCAQCHIRVSGSTLYIDKIVNNSNYSVTPTRTVQHTITGVTSGSIYDYGMCFSCHNGTKATKVSPYHAKPATASSSNRYNNMLYAPGRGSFNLFWSNWHGREDSSFGSRSNESNQNKYQNPTISFQMIPVPCASYNGCSGSSTTNVPILPAKTVPNPAGDAVHNNFTISANCLACHSSSSEVERTVGIHGECTTCHTNNLPAVVSTILGGIAGNQKTCDSCHDGTINGAPYHGSITLASAGPLHDRLGVYSSCGSCHTVGNGSFSAIYTLHRGNCATCHGNSDSAVQNTISAGKNGTAVNCTNCHGTSHHESPQAKAGNCTWCHVDPRESWTTMRPGDNGSSATFPTQMACKTCHVRVSGTTIYIDRISYTNYRTAPTRTVQHTLTGITAGIINNYGICMSCHNGSKAVRVDLFHAKPTSPTNIDRYDNMSTAPGRGTLNLFWSDWHGDKDNDYGDKDNENNQDRFRNPTVSFQKIAVPCASFNGCSGATSKQVPVLPAVANATSAGPGDDQMTNRTTHINFTTSGNCSACHNSSTETDRTVGIHIDCSTCHGSSLSSVTNSILNGVAGSSVSCENCHDGTTNGALIHDAISPEEIAPRHDRLGIYSACGSCHNIGDGSFMALYSLHRNDCGTCHGSSDSAVVNAINAGKTGTAVNCTNCHGSSHHESPQAREGNCTWCHADPRGSWSPMRPGDNGGASPLPTQLACATCHTRVVGTTLYIDKLTYANGSYATAPTRTSQHTFTGMTNPYIYNYGACFSCHNGTKATKVNVWHAKPATTPSSNRYSALAGIQGRGKFNIFWSSYHGYEDANFGSKSFNGNENDFQTPTAGYNFKLAVPCGSFNGCSGGTTVSVPVLASKPAPVAGPGSENRTPVAGSNAYTITRNSSNNSLAVLANDSDPDGDALTISAVGARSNGGAVENNGTTLSYTPAANFTGTETFTYTVKDPAGLAATATVTITVSNDSNTPQAPMANNDSYSVTTGSSNNALTVLANDTDPNGDSLTISAIGAGSNGGSVSNNGTSLSYTPAAGYAGTETFIYTVRDPGGLTATATVTITVGSGSSGSTGAVVNLNQWASLTTGSSASFAASSDSSRLVLVAVHYEYSANTTPNLSVTYGGKALTQIGKTNNSRNDVWIGYLKEADISARTSNTIAASFSSSPTTYSIAAATYSGVDQVSPIQGMVVNQATNGSSSSNPTFNGLSVVNKGYALYSITANEGATFTPPLGYTEHYDKNDSGNNYRYSTASKPITTNGTESKTISMGYERWGMVAVSLKPAL